jgi:hypothetical protein
MPAPVVKPPDAFQVFPPSTLRKIAAAGGPGGCGTDAEKKTLDGFRGSMAREPTYVFAGMPVSSAFQVAPPSVLLKIPGAAVAA